ncbi:MAG TPA: amidase family protein [Bacillales bacterium]|nr:amidase family protein [Bacillales bacterium]
MNLSEWSVDDLQKAMASGELTSEQIVLAYMEQIAKHNHEGAAINAVLEINPDALDIAAALDAERAESGARGPLHGIPVLLKDNIDTGDKMHASAGSLALKDSYAAKDSFVAKQLREAGAVILGKTNLTEWANFMTEGMPNGYSSRGGQVLNPYGPCRHDPGGSSSGSAAAVAANMTALAVGTETSGSILSPASAHALVGVKPTVGLVSRSGIIPIAHSQDTAGPMARSVRDAALLLGALAGPDPEDPATGKAPREREDYTKHLDANGMNGASIGVVREGCFEELEPEQRKVMEAAIAQLERMGARVVDPVAIASAGNEWTLDVLVHEFKADLNAYLAKLAPGQPHSLREVIAYNEAHAESVLKYGQTLLLEAEATSGTLTEAAYLESRIHDIENSRENGIDRAMAEHGLDALRFRRIFGADMPARAGYPSITVPGGFTATGEPFGVTFTARAFEEGVLIKLAYAFEQATKHRRAPRL